MCDLKEDTWEEYVTQGCSGVALQRVWKKESEG